MSYPIIDIEKKYLPEIESLRAVIAQHTKDEDILIDKLTKRLRLKTAMEREILWDYIYNDSEWMIRIVDDAK